MCKTLTIFPDSDKKWDFNIQMKAILEEAEAVSSVRSQQILDLMRGLRLALGRPVKETIVRKPIRPRAIAGGSLSSSEDSGEDYRRRKRTRKKRHPRRDAGSEVLDTSNDTPELPGWLFQVRSNLAALCDLVVIMPHELRVLKLLSYDSIDSREDSIQEAEAGTFGWMLDESTDPELQPHMIKARQTFVSWLSSGNGVFHISGKAGSGKSTLLKFLRHHDRTLSELKQWAGDKEIVFSSYYFWNSGNPMQMSLEGLYRSLLMEVSRQCPGLIPHLFPDQWGSLSSGQVLGEIMDTDAIKMAFERLRTMETQPNYRMCFFIDGLDEYSITADDPDYWSLSKSLFEWGKTEGVKLCVSARPYQQFLETFTESQRLHLHELTSQDIKTFANKSFHWENKGGFEMISEKLVSAIIERSEGVFVWARTAVRSLLAQMKHGASPGDLLQEVSAYPIDIDELYSCILDSLEPHERLQSNRMLLLTARNPFSQPLNALWLSWFDELENPNFPSSPRPYSAAEVSTRHQNVQAALEWLTKGLLDMYTDRRERKQGDQFYRQRVQFFHRTARDFLRSPARIEALQQSLDFSKLPETFCRLRLAEIVLAGKYKKTPGADPRRRRLYFNHVRSLFSLRDNDGNRFQIPQQYMRVLNTDLATTRTWNHGASYAISAFKSISNHNVIDEDPEKSASFLHFALAHGQHKYVIKELRDGAQVAGSRQLSLLLSAALGYHRCSVEVFQALLPYTSSPLAKIKIRPPTSNDILASTYFEISTLMVFVSAVVFACLSEHRRKDSRGARSAGLKEAKHLFSMLSHLVEVARDKQRETVPAQTSSNLGLEFICILKSTKAKETQDILFTTLGEIAALLTGGEKTDLDAMVLDGDASGAEQNEDLPRWAAPRVGLASGIAAHFITHGQLGDYHCSQVVSEGGEDIKATDNLFFRMY